MRHHRKTIGDRVLLAEALCYFVFVGIITIAIAIIAR